ncbi:MAG: hypothetical protein CMN85_05405 [Spongiibacteraceae bacterium]|nr:hypothetical protein [Spongiibacteraceae bacterium]
MPAALRTSGGLYYGWVIVGLAFMMQALASGGINALFGVFAVPFSDSFSASRAQVLIATASVAMIASGLLSPLAGYWLSRYSPKHLIMAGGVMLSAGFLAMTQVQALWQISMIYALCWSAGNCLFGTLAANTSVSNWFVAQRGKALGFAAIGMSLGTFSLPPLVSWLIVDYGWRVACGALSGLVALSLPAIWLWYRNKPEDLGLNVDGSADMPEEVASGSGADSWRQVLSSRYFWLITACISICFAGFNGLTVNLIPMAIDQGVDPKTASLLMSVAAFFGVIGKLAVGFSADRLGARLALLLPLMALALACTILWGAPDFNRLLVAAAMIGLSSGGAIPVWGSLVGLFFGRRLFSLVMGMMNPLLVPLIVACAPFVSWVYERDGSYNQALLVILVFIAVAVSLIPLLRAPLNSAPETAPVQNR